MGENTKIEWATHTLNFWEGCTKVSEGCANCYAADRDQRFHGGLHWGPGAPRRLTSVANWAQADKWNREAEASGVRPRVFVNSLSDIFDPEVEIEWLAKALDTFDRCPCVDFLLVTKRPELWSERMEMVSALGESSDADTGPGVARQWLKGNAPSNVWVGTTVENQARADERIPDLLKIPARVRFLSCEPLLGPVDIEAAGGLWADLKGRHLDAASRGLRGIDWVICGGESGHGARPMHPDWARSLRDQCTEAGVAFFFKQWGEHAWVYSDDDEDDPMPIGSAPQPLRVGKAAAGRKLDGREHNAIPEVRR